MAEEIYWHPEAEDDIAKLNREKRELVMQKVKEFSEKGAKYRHFGRVTANKHDFDMYRIKIKEEEPLEINQRVIIDRYHESWIIWGVKHRKDVYDSEFIEQIMEREY
jgi:hypothetical protein